MVDGAWLDGRAPAALKTVAALGPLGDVGPHAAHVKLADGTILSVDGLAAPGGAEAATVRPRRASNEQDR